jgi:glycerophosphoryl diester phosphodiesterase
MEVSTKKKIGKFFKAFFKTIAIILAILLTIAVILIALIKHDWKDTYKEYDTDNKYIVEYMDTMVSAHRSGRGIFPENTMMAIEGCLNAQDYEIDVFEFDLHITGDGELIILHDSTLDRTTDAVEYFGKEEIRPEDYTYEELRTLNFGESFETDAGEMPYKGLRGEDVPDNLRVAKLVDVLTYIQSKGDFDYIIEIKNSMELGYKAADELYRILSDLNLVDKVVVGTFNEEVSEYLDNNYPEISRSASQNEVILVYALSLFGIKTPDSVLKFDALQVPMERYGLNLANAHFVNYAHKHNLAVQYWTINDEDDMRLLQEIGADCIMSDVPDVAYRIYNE